MSDSPELNIAQLLTNFCSYERIVYRILYEAEPAESVAAKRLLGWLACAIRPLRWHEVQGATSYDVEDHTFDFEEGKFRKDPKRLCGSLVDMYADTEIRLVHLTAKLYVFEDTCRSPALIDTGTWNDTSFNSMKKNSIFSASA